MPGAVEPCFFVYICREQNFGKIVQKVGFGVFLVFQTAKNRQIDLDFTRVLRYNIY